MIHLKGSGDSKRPSPPLREESRLALPKCTARSFDDQLREQFLGKFESRWVLLKWLSNLDRMAVRHVENAWLIRHQLQKGAWIDRRMRVEFDPAPILIECEPANSHGLTVELEFTDSKKRFRRVQGVARSDRWLLAAVHVIPLHCLRPQSVYRTPTAHAHRGGTYLEIEWEG